MIRLVMALGLPLLMIAADDRFERGAAIYRTTCAVAYCHSIDGKPGRAPGFVGRKLEPASIAMTVSRGIPNTSMPAFGSALQPADIEAVVVYVMSFAGAASAPASSSAPMKLPPEIERGRVLFFDPGRMGSCGYCHEVAGRGAPVSLALHDLRTAQLDLKSVRTAAGVTAQPAGEEPFPALVAERSPLLIRVYDLSSRLPVLRTFAPSDVKLVDGSSWRHPAATDIYSRAELDEIERYLKWMAARP